MKGNVRKKGKEVKRKEWDRKGREKKGKGKEGEGKGRGRKRKGKEGEGKTITSYNNYTIFLDKLSGYELCEQSGGKHVVLGYR